MFLYRSLKAIIWWYQVIRKRKTSNHNRQLQIFIFCCKIYLKCWKMAKLTNVKTAVSNWVTNFFNHTQLFHNLAWRLVLFSGQMIVQIQRKNTRTMFMNAVLVLLLFTLNKYLPHWVEHKAGTCLNSKMHMPEWFSQS